MDFYHLIKSPFNMNCLDRFLLIIILISLHEFSDVTGILNNGLPIPHHYGHIHLRIGQRSAHFSLSCIMFDSMSFSSFKSRKNDVVASNGFIVEVLQYQKR